MCALHVFFVITLYAALDTSAGHHFSRTTKNTHQSSHTHLNTSQTTYKYNFLWCSPTLSQARLSPHELYPFRVGDCLKLCAGRDNRYAAIDNSNRTCYCTQEVDDGHEVLDSQCSRCADDNSRMCGGVNTMAIYDVMSVTIEGSEMKDMDVLIARKHGVALLDGSHDSWDNIFSSGFPVTAVDYHYHHWEAYALSDNIIFGFSMSANSSEYELVHVRNGVTFTVDWVHDHLIWPECGSSPSIMMADLDGSNRYTLVTIPAAKQMWISDIVVDPYTGLLFWLTADSLMRCNLDGSGLTHVSKLPTETTTGLTLDMQSRRVYFTGPENGGSTIFYVLYNESSVNRVHNYSIGDPNVWWLGLFRSTVFYVGHGDGKSSYFQNADNETTIFRTNQVINHMKIVHPQLQQPVEEDACTDYGCSHYCVIDAGVATCLCPKHLTLKENHLFCTEDEKLPIFIAILLGLGLLVSILLAAGILMCICDKLWSKVHPTVVRIGDSIFKRPFVYVNRQQENLI